MNYEKDLGNGLILAPALLLDLDGTVRRCKSGKPFIEDIEDIEIMPGIEKIIWRYRDFGFSIIGISNQGGVAHGFKSRATVDKEVERTMDLFKANPFHNIYSSFNDPKGSVSPWNVRSLLRKPEIGMLAIVEVEYFKMGVVIDWDRSLFVGDRPEDEECAKRAAIPFRHITSFLNEPHEFTVG